MQLLLPAQSETVVCYKCSGLGHVVLSEPYKTVLQDLSKERSAVVHHIKIVKKLIVDIQQLEEEAGL